MLWLCAFLVTPLLAAAPVASTPLVTLSSTHGDKATGAWSRDLVLFADGRWKAGDRHGKLDADALAAIRDEAKALVFDGPPIRDTCRARAVFHQRLTTKAGSADESTPCGVRWPSAVADLAQHLKELTGPTRGGRAVLLQVLEANRWGGAWQARTTIFANGLWETQEGAHGRLGARELATLGDAVRDAKFVLAPEGALCEAMPTRRTKLIAGGRSIEWSSPCSTEPDPSIVDLLTKVQGLMRAE
ncbi:MAG: hypothetical protein U1F43_04625 [Myxococcota bacterium]